MTKLELDRQDTLDRLDEALDSILTLRIALGGLPDDLPAMGLDTGLKHSRAHQAARARFRTGWDALVETSPGGPTNSLALDLEARINEMSVVAAEVGWQMAMAAGVERLDR